MKIYSEEKWKKVRLEECAVITMGQSPASTTYNYEKEGIPFYQGNADFGDIYPKIKCYCTKPIKIANKEEILLSVRAPVGKINIANTRCCIGRGLCSIKVKENKCEMKFLYYLLKSKEKNLNERANGSTFKAINKNQISEIDFYLPNIEIQKKIVLILDKLVEILRDKKEILLQLEELSKSIFIEMFGDPIKNEKKWIKIQLQEECEIITGNTPSRKEKEYYGNYIEWIKSDNIIPFTLYPTKAKEFLSEIGVKKGRKIEKNNILMTCIAGSINSIGNVSITDREVSFNQQINGIKVQKNNVWFMFKQFEFSKKYIQSSITMSLKGILSKSKLSELYFIFPPIELQNQFAERIKMIEKSKFLFEKYRIKDILNLNYKK